MKRSVLAAVIGFSLIGVVSNRISVAAAQQESHGARVRSLNNQLLEVHGRLTGLPAGQRMNARALQNQAAAILSQRGEALKALIHQNPSAALSLAFPAGLLSDLAASYPESARQLETVGKWEGTVEYLVEDHASSNTHRNIRRMQLNGETVEVQFAAAEPQDLKSGDLLQVEGVKVGTEIAAAGGTITGTTDTPAAMCTPIGDQRSLVVLLTMPGVTPPAISAASVADIFFATSGRSVSEFWRENSYGATTASGDVLGWFTLDANYTCGQTSEIRDAAIRAVDATVDFRQYSRIFFILSGVDGSCGWAGIATVGCSSLSSSGDGTFTASTAWMLSNLFETRDSGVKLAIHEGGHNLGIHHATSRDFGTEALGAPGTSGISSEYGDEFSTMGAWTFAHYGAPHKVQLGWIASDMQTVTANGSFLIQPTETNGALHTLKIRRGEDDNNWLWMEYRKPIGLFDSTIGTQVFGGGLIHYQDVATGSRTNLLDFSPQTSSWSDPALAAGETWVDPYTNLSIAVGNATSAGLEVNVAYAAVPCVETQPSVTMFPFNPGAYPGGDVTYTIAVTNNDNASCGARRFDLSSLIPDTWATTFSQTSLILNPGTAASATVTKSVPESIAPAMYSVDALVTGRGSPVEATANVTVMPPCTEMPATVVISPETFSAYPGETVRYSIAVTNNDTATCGAKSFNISSMLPAGWTTSVSQNSLTLWPASAASITMSKTVPLSASAGTYDVDTIVTGGSLSAYASTNVVIHAPPCTALAPTVTLSPSSVTAYSGDNIGFAISVTNNDSGSCAPRSFSVSSLLPAAWTTSFSQTSVILAPSARSSLSMSKAIPSSTAVGTYAVNVLVGSGGSSVEALAGITVQSKPTVLNISISVDAGPYAKNSTISIAAKALQGSVAAAGVSVQFTMVGPTGAITTKKIVADSRGQAVWNYRVGAKDPKGAYQVKAQTTLGTQTATSGSASFSIQ